MGKYKEDQNLIFEALVKLTQIADQHEDSVKEYRKRIKILEENQTIIKNKINEKRAS